MTLALESFPAPASPLGRLDPRWKLAAFLPATLLIALLRTVPPAVVALLLAVMLVIIGRIPARWYRRRLLALGVFLLFFVVWLPWLVPGGGWDLGPLHASLAGLTLALRIVLKAFAMVTLMLVLFTTAPLESTLKAAHQLRLPALLTHLTLLSYRYVFLLAEELGRLRIALRVRGYRNRPNLHSYRTVGHVTGALLIRGYERAERVGQAMRCRAFDGHFRSLTEFHARRADVGWFCLILLSAAALLLWDRLAGE